MTARAVVDHNGDPVTLREVDPDLPAARHDARTCTVPDCWACAWLGFPGGAR